jgi:membrane fusion protein, multidrug efflux system
MNKLIIILTGVVFLFGGCKSGTDKRAELEKLKKEHDRITAQITQLESELNPSSNLVVTPVITEVLKKAPFSHYIEVQGRVDGNENIGVSPRTVGVVTKIFVSEGDYVKKGQVLAEQDAEVLKQNLNDLKNQLAFVTELYQKQKNLWDQKIGSEVQYLTAKNNMESVQNKIATIEDQIKMSTITSPIDGTVEDIPAKIGQLATVGVPAFRVVNFSRAKVVADVGEAYSAKIKTGDQVKIFLPDFNEEFEERVTFASKFISPVNRTFTVEARLSPDKNVYRANMIAVIKIKDYFRPDAVAIPQNYIQTSKAEGQFVFVAAEENGKKLARKRYIKTGVSYNGLTEITDGLKEGDRIITAGYKDLFDGQSIDYK